MSSPRLVILGLDGGTFDVLTPLIAEGRLPNLARLVDQGLSTELRSTMPPATLPAWTSFLCGVSPEVHGVTDIFVHPKRSYALTPSHAGLRTRPTFLKRLSDLGLRVVSVGVPGTYPPEEVHGLVVSGFDAPFARAVGQQGVAPASYYPRLLELGGWRYATFNELKGGGARHTSHLADATRALLADLAKKEGVLLGLLDELAPDVFFAHLQASDTVGHHLWHAYDRASPRHSPELAPLASALPDVYARLDALIGRVLEKAGPSTRVLVVSDHGMGGASDVGVHLNRYLSSKGLLRFRRGPATHLRRGLAPVLRRLAAQMPAPLLGHLLSRLPAGVRATAMGLARNQGIEFKETQAFSDELDYAPAIWLNTRERFPNGTLSAGEAEVIADQLAQDLVRDLVHPKTKAPLVRRVLRGAKNAATPMPDLLLEPAWPGGYRPSFLVSAGEGPAVRTLRADELNAPKGAGMPGVHRREGIFIAHGDGLPAMQLPAFDIAAAGAFVYSLLGLTPPSDVAPLPPFLASLAEDLRTRGQAPVPTANSTAPSAYSDAENAVVTERLKNLGYIE